MLALPIAALHARDLTERHAHSARPGAPVRATGRAPAAPRRSPGAVRRVLATALRRSADRLAPAIE
jgi:hypothetical protein